MAAGEGRREPRAARRGSLQPRGRADRPRRRARSVHAGDGASHPLGAEPVRGSGLGARSQRGGGGDRRDRSRTAALPADRAAGPCVIDTHAHLAALDDADEAVARAAEAGVTRILTVGTDVDDCRRALSLAERHEGVFAILGIHPHEAGTATTDDLAALRDLLEHPKAVAVGETGLDWYRDYAPHDAQRRLFAAELELASELGKPVVIHTRAADDDTFAALDDFTGTVVLHCFSSPRMLPIALQRGWYVSFAGNATFPKAVDLRLAA
ncbi:MAG: TatD family deoxyribonuclease, partial [Actinobacteria bacterium]